MIARKSALVGANAIVSGFLGLVALSVTTAYILPEELGGYRLAFSLLGLVYFITDLGFGPAHVKRVSEGYDEADCFATFATFKLVSSAAFLLAALGIMAYFVVAGPSKHPDFNLGSFVVLTLYFVAIALRSTFQSTFDARRESARLTVTLLSETIFRVAAVLVIVYVVAAASRNAGPLLGIATPESPIVRFIAEHVEASYAAAFAFGGVASLLFAASAWKRGRGVVGRFRWDILRSYWSFALPIFLVGVIGTVSAYVDSLFLGLFWSKADVGVLVPAQSLRVFLEAIPYSVAALLFPTLSAMHGSADWPRMREIVGRSTRYIGLITFPIVAFVAAFAPDLTHVFLSDRYLPGATALALLALYSLVISLQRPFVALVSGAGRSDLAARVGIAMTFSNIALNFVLIPADIKSLGITLAGLRVTGAALATLISGVIGLAMVRVYAGRLAGGGFGTTRDLARQLAATLVMVGALLALELVFPFARWYAFPVYTAAGAAVYFAVLAGLGGFTREDVKLMWDTVHVGEMWRYLRTEVLHRK